ncbi:MAG: glycosyltransferase [Candidatus Acidiferrales bacterium]
MKVTLAYLIPVGEWETYGPGARKFAVTYKQFPAEIEHELVVVTCNGPVTSALSAFFKDIANGYEEYYGAGRDCGAAQLVAKKCDADFLVIANADVHFSRAGWLRRLVEARVEHGDGLYGATASYESYPYIPGCVNPHIRTSFYGFNPETLRQYPFKIDNQEKCFKFESGEWKFMQWVEDRGEPCMLVTWDGSYAKQDFRKPPNVFRKGNQSNNIIHDRHTRIYDLADPRRRRELEISANGGLMDPAGSPASRSASGNGSADAKPLVSIGMPVYNGEKYLRQALTSLLAQDYTHFELIISDNGSTDSTETICREYQAWNSRIRFIRHSENRGSPWNFAYVAREARGKYFMWAAHDDLWDPSYIRKCLQMLEAHPEAILCCTEDTVCDENGVPIPQWASYKNICTLGMTPPQRIHELISRMGWFAFYGLMRREAVEHISLGLNVLGFDVVLLLELLLLGDFAKVDEHLFATRSTAKGKNQEEYRRDLKLEPAPTTMHFANSAALLLRTVYQSALSPREKTEVFADFILTLSCQNPPWRKFITEELLGKDASLGETQFAFLLGLVLNGCVPFDQIRYNPLCEAIYRSADAMPNLLRMARKILGKPEPKIPVAQIEKCQQASRLFEQGNLEGALKLFSEALNIHEGSSAWCDWATVHLAFGHRPEAERGFRRALWWDPDNRQAAMKLGILLANIGKIPESVPFLEESVEGINGDQRTAVLQLLGECRAKMAV